MLVRNSECRVPKREKSCEPRVYYVATRVVDTMLLTFSNVGFTAAALSIAEKMNSHS